MAVEFEITQIDEIVHGRLRLGIMIYLAHAEAADFTELKTKLRTTQGNLSVQLRKLEDAGYISIDKSFLDRKPLTRARLSKSGRKALSSYLNIMSKVTEARSD
jgi:DNA-binding MarR family transcriptional regulator